MFETVIVCVHWTAITTVQLVRKGLTVKTEKVLFRQCRHIRTASWGSTVREINRLWAMSVWNKIQKNMFCIHWVSSRPLARHYFVHLCLSFSSVRLPLVYIFDHLVWVFLLGSLPRGRDTESSVLVFSRRAGPKQNNAAPPLWFSHCLVPGIDPSAVRSRKQLRHEHSNTSSPFVNIQLLQLNPS